MDKIWRPTKRQEDFLSLPDSLFEALFGGAAGGGKTETLLMLPITRQFYNHPRFKMLFLRRTFPELDNEVIPRSKEYFPLTGALPYQDQKKRWTWPSGAIVQFGHCEHEKDVTKYDTSEYNIIAFDELTSFTEYQYMYLAMSRCRSASPELPAIVRSGTNPGNIGHGFVRKRFVEPARDGYKILRDIRTTSGETSELLRIYIPSKATDNTYLMANDPGYLDRLNRLPEAERAAKRDGDWWTFSGQVFDEWRVAPFPDEPLNAQHVVAPFQIPDYWPKVLAIDWGYAAMTVAGWFTIDPSNKRIYQYREYTCKKTKISTWSADIRRKTGDEKLEAVVLDPSAWGNRGDSFTIAEQFAQEFGRFPIKADNDRVGGCHLLHELLRWAPRPPRYTPPEGYDANVEMSIWRLKGDKARDEYVAMFQPEAPETTLPKIQFFDTCEETIKAIPLCVSDKDRPEDVAEFVGDDPYDMARYGAKACQLYLDTGKIEQERLSDVAKVCSALERTGNWTNFHMQMDKLESRQRNEWAGVRRFHGRRYGRTR
jgi:phage terminase large subunit